MRKAFGIMYLKDVRFSDKSQYEGLISENQGIDKASDVAIKYYKDTKTNSKRIILTTMEELRRYLEESFEDGNVDRSRALFMKVSDRIADVIFKMSEGKIDTKNSYWELDSNDVYHSQEHMNPKALGDLPMSIEDYQLSLKRLNEGEVFVASRNSKGSAKIEIGVPAPDGRYIFIDFAIGDKHNAVPTIRVKTEWKVIESKYQEYKNSKGVTGRYSPILNSPNPNLALSEERLSQAPDFVNEDSLKSSWKDDEGNLHLDFDTEEFVRLCGGDGYVYNDN